LKKTKTIKELQLFNEKVLQFESIDLNADLDEGLRALAFFFPNNTMDPLEVISAHYESKKVPENFRLKFKSTRQKYFDEMDKTANIRFPSRKSSKISRDHLLRITLSVRLFPNELTSKEEAEDRTLYHEILASSEGQKIEGELQNIALIVLVVLKYTLGLNLKVLEVLDAKET